tara:strand:- start:233 stop:526 length:294 start_codon:yes stop_codon:yes gene_type:complete
MIPFTPHLAHECLEKMGVIETDTWPEISNLLVVNETTKIAVQINGKTKEIIEVKKDLDEKEALYESKKNKKVAENLNNKEIIKTFFVKNKIINYLIK